MMAPPSEEKAVLIGEDPAHSTCLSACQDAFRPEPKLIPYKLFVLLFFGAIGCVFPYMAIYMKQLGLDPIQIGIIFGVRPIMSIFGAPFLGSMADRYNIRRCVLIVACVCFTGSYLAIGHVPPPRLARTCPPYFSISEGNVSDIQSPNWRLNESVPTSVVDQRKAVLSWMYRGEDVQRTLVFVLVFSMVGEIFFGSIGALGDTALIHQVGRENLGKYSRQRSWGAVGMAVFMLLMGGLLSLTRETRVICGLHLYFTYYRLAFYIFVVVMVMVTAVSFALKPGGSQERAKDIQMAATFNEGEKSAVAAEESTTEHSPMAVLRLFLSLHYGSLLFAIFYMGVCNGTIFGFLFWHLENLGASQLLMGVAGGLASFSEFVFYYGAEWFVRKTGAMVTTYIAVLCYAIRFANYAFMEEPWLVLPSELLQGFTFATAWVAMVEYTSAAVPEVSLGTVMGILHGVYWGLGIGGGQFLGGVLIQHFGARVTFKIYIVASVVVALLVFIVQKLSVKPVHQGHTAAETERNVDSGE